MPEDNSSPDDIDASPREQWRMIVRHAALDLTPLDRAVGIAIDDAGGNQRIARETLKITQRQVSDCVFALQRHDLVLMLASGLVKRRYTRNGLDKLARITRARLSEPPQ